MEHPIASADAIATKWPSVKSTMPGRTMIKAPMKPRAIANQRRVRTTSPRTSAAPIVVKSGARKLRAVCSPIGISVTA